MTLHQRLRLLCEACPTRRRHLTRPSRLFSARDSKTSTADGSPEQGGPSAPSPAIGTLGERGHAPLQQLVVPRRRLRLCRSGCRQGPAYTKRARISRNIGPGYQGMSGPDIKDNNSCGVYEAGRCFRFEGAHKLRRARVLDKSRAFTKRARISTSSSSDGTVGAAAGARTSRRPWHALTRAPSKV